MLYFIILCNKITQDYQKITPRVIKKRVNVKCLLDGKI